MDSILSANIKLQSFAATQTGEIKALQAVVLDRLPTPEAKRKAVRYLKERYAASQHHLCELLGLALSSMHYKAKPDGNDQIRNRIHELSAEHRDWGYRRIHDQLRREGYEINHKRTERLYREENLMLKDM
jgi:putative transposase